MIDVSVIVAKAAMTGNAVVGGATGGALLARCRAGEDAGRPMALAASIMDLVIGAAERNAGYTPGRAGMTIGTVRV